MAAAWQSGHGLFVARLVHKEGETGPQRAARRVLPLILARMCPRRADAARGPPRDGGGVPSILPSYLVHRRTLSVCERGLSDAGVACRALTIRFNSYSYTY